MSGRYGCVWPGCDVDSQGPEGGAIFRVSPKGGVFYGMCGPHKARAEGHPLTGACRPPLGYMDLPDGRRYIFTDEDRADVAAESPVLFRSCWVPVADSLTEGEATT